MHTGSAESISLGKLRNSLEEVIDGVSCTQQRITVSKNGKPVAVIVSIADLKLLERLEDQADIEALRQTESEDDGVRISWEDFLAGRVADIRAGRRKTVSLEDLEAELSLDD
ncbi:type II toxin-antitoxin system prevent-host-death family antitoxin [Curtobacterium sp. S6]|uniref:type II toxin-antitoxin system prevent-host-death family antitoxin n=1 Tax=Curtobacterium sp. S6 TaxID=1479623 RepID=UPI0009E97BAD|nr:type II toxin-antitoxin system prevent-host-death family antitoxin [Curtobacterium sp. S6]